MGRDHPWVALDASADVRRDAAGELRRCAEELRGALDPVRSRSGPQVWIGPAADRFAFELYAALTGLRHTADALDDAAGACVAEAGRLEHEASRLRQESARESGVRPR